MTQTLTPHTAWNAANVSIVSSDWQAQPQPARAAVQRLETRELQQKLLHAVTTNPDKEAALVAVGLVVEAVLSPAWLMYFDRTESGLVSRPALFDGKPPPPHVPPPAILAACNTACEQGKQHTARLGEQGAMIVAERVFLKGRAPDAVALVIPHGTYALESLSCVAQLVASHLTLWHVLQNSSQLESESRVFAAVLELAGKLACAHNLQGACLTAAGTIQTHLACQRVAIGIAANGSQRCRLQALSGASKFDRHSELARALEAALDETLVRDTIAVWPPTSESTHGSSLALQRLCALTECTSAASVPLRDESGKSPGAWIVLGKDNAFARPDSVHFLRACQTPLGSCLRLWQRAERGRLPRLVEYLLEKRKLWQTKAIIAAVLLAAVVLAIPLPYKIPANCKLQPVMRRFVAAPFDGLLEKSLVAPGDLVSAGDVLARLDGREIRWELAGVTADYNRASKQADSARAVHNVAAAQQARLEMERLELKIKLLEDRAKHLEVKSPLSGIVVSGDLEKTEGAPLSVGQPMFEVAPLDKMIVELAVPEEDVAYVAVGSQARVQLEAYANERWTGTVVRLHPRAEIRDEQNVFVAELEFDNDDGRLRPGLAGTAKIVGPSRPLVWNLFHKAWERLITAVGW